MQTRKQNYEEKAAVKKVIFNQKQSGRLTKNWVRSLYEEKVVPRCIKSELTQPSD